MSNRQCKITHLYHSGFLIETSNSLLVFDYVPSLNDSCLEVVSNKIKNVNKVFVFVTHGHGDHYNPEIFNWKDLNSNIKYIISSDIEIDNVNNEYFIMNKYEEVIIDNIKVKTYGTTDRGLSYFVEVDGLSIYHAGDLNWWHWKDDSDEAHRKEEEDFKSEVDKIKEPHIDIVFFPVDPRLEEFSYLGGEYFVRTINPKLLVPMHFGDSFGVCKDFADRVKDLKSDITVLTKPCDEILY